VIVNAINQNNTAIHSGRVESSNHARSDKTVSESDDLQDDKRQNPLEEQIEKINIKRILNMTNGDAAKTASLLNMSYMTLLQTISRYNIYLTPTSLISVHV